MKTLVAPPSRMEVFDWYDGPREGVCTFPAPLGDVHFRLLDERPTRDGPDQRIFALSTLPEGAVERAASLRDLIAESEPPCFVIATEDFETIEGPWSHPREEPEDWFVWATERGWSGAQLDE